MHSIEMNAIKILPMLLTFLVDFDLHVSIAC